MTSLAAMASDMEARYAALRQAAETYLDHQDARIRTSNRIGSLTVNVADYAAYAAGMKDLEGMLSKRLVVLYREVAPSGVREWQRATPGIGEHLLALLLGHLGHPRLAVPKYWAENETSEGPKRMLVNGEPFVRSLAQLRAYCGHGDAEHRRKKGMTQEDGFALGNASCKRALYLLGESVVRSQVRKDEDGGESLAAMQGYSDGVPRIAKGALGQLYLDQRVVYVSRNGRTPAHVDNIARRHMRKHGILPQLFDAAREEWCQ